jgi:hypothetical protein
MLSDDVSNTLWQGQFSIAPFDHHPSAPYLLLWEGEGGEGWMTVQTLMEALQRWADLPRRVTRGSMAIIVDSTRAIAHGHVWTDHMERPLVAGCEVILAELERLGLIHPVELAFMEMDARGDLDDLRTLEAQPGGV